VKIATLFVNNLVLAARGINHRKIIIAGELSDFLCFEVITAQIEFAIPVRKKIQPVFRPDWINIVGASFRLGNFFY